MPLLDRPRPRHDDAASGRPPRCGDGSHGRIRQAEFAGGRKALPEGHRGLRRSPRRTRGELDPQVAAVLQKNLTVIDQAITESRDGAQGRSRRAPNAQDGLFDALRIKVALLQQTVELINEMRKGNQAEAGRRDADAVAVAICMTDIRLPARPFSALALLSRRRAGRSGRDAARHRARRRPAHAAGSSATPRRARAPNRSRRSRRPTRSATAPRSTCRTSSGDIRVTGGSGSEITIEATKRVRHRDADEAKRLLAALRIDVNNFNGRVEVRTIYPRRGSTSATTSRPASTT